MKYFSTFSGIGGFEIGIERAFSGRQSGAHQQDGQMGQDSPDASGEHAWQSPVCVGYSEIDKYAVKVYEKQFGGECENCRLARERERDSGTSGRQETLNSERTRLPQTVRNNDNAKNERSENDRTTCEHTPKNFGDITKINAEELPDFDCLVGGFPCQAFSIAGKRKGFEDTRGTLFFDLARILRAKQPRLFVFENVKGLLSHDSGRTFKTIIETIDELGYDCQWQVLNSKNHRVPQNRERVYIVGHLRGTPRPEVFPIAGTDSADTFIRTIRTGGAASYTEKHARDIIQVNQPVHSNDRVYASDGIGPTLNTMQGGNRQPKIVAQRGRYNSDGKTQQQLEPRPDDISNTLTAVQKDNMVMIPEATKKGYAEATPGQAINLSVPNSKTRRGRVSDIAPTLDTGMQIHTLVDDTYGTGLREYKDTAPTLRTGRQGLKVSDDVRIRRLTPIECERLQGFPDDWTKTGVQDGVQVEISDTQRYKMCGNAVTTNVVQAVFERILK